MTTDGELTHEYDIPTPNSRSLQIAAGHDWALWFTKTRATNKSPACSRSHSTTTVTTRRIPHAVVGLPVNSDGTARHTITAPPGITIQPDWQVVRS